MMKPITILFLISLASCHELGQETAPVCIKTLHVKDSLDIKNSDPRKVECIHKGYSNDFYLKTNFKRFSDGQPGHDSCILNVYIFEGKSDHLMDSINISSLEFQTTSFNGCDYGMTSSHGYRIYSLSIGKDTSNWADNFEDFGDIIVADLNFDKRDDFAIMNNWGQGKGGKYNFYIQNDKKEFELDSYLTDSMIYFPIEINKQKKYLLTKVEIGKCGYDYIYKKYRREKGNNIWKNVSSKRTKICDW